MESITEQRKRHLESEIALAESLLLENLNNLKITDYAFPTSDILPAVKNQFLNDPLETVETLHFLSKNFLPEDNNIRKIMRYANLAVKGIQMVNDNR